MVVNGRTGLLSNAAIEISGAGPAGHAASIAIVHAGRAACVYEMYEFCVLENIRWIDPGVHKQILNINKVAPTRLLHQ